MKFDVEIPSLDGIARLEIRTVKEGGRWAAYLSFLSGRSSGEACLMLGREGIPHRFTGANREKAEEAAKAFLQKNYRVARMIW